MVNKLSKKLFAPRIGVRYVAAFSDTPYLFCARTLRWAAHFGFTFQIFKEPFSVGQPISDRKTRQKYKGDEKRVRGLRGYEAIKEDMGG